MQKYIEKMTRDMDLRGITPSTQEPYVRRIKIFLTFIQKEVDAFDMYDIRKFIEYLMYEKKLSIGTINCYISAIMFFFKYTIEREWNYNIVRRIKGYTSFPAVLSKEEVIIIFKEIRNIKHKAILALLYGSGLRVSEVVKLKVQDIDSKNKQIFIAKSKNRSDRYAILSDKTIEILRMYWLNCGKPKDWLFPGAKEGEHITVKTVKNLMLNIKSRLNIKKKISAHTLRHCFATHLLESNVSLAYIQQLLGHRSINTTSKYLHMTSKSKMGIISPFDTLEET